MERTEALTAWLRENIAAQGPLPFRAFMEAALYHPTLGYYRRDEPVPVGRRGDFYTNVSVGPLFGQLLGLQFAQMWELLGSPPAIALIEQGAHNGLFLRDLLDSLRRDRPAFYQAVHAVLLEPSPALRSLQAQTLSAHAEKITWHPTPASVGTPFPHALFFSNELVDSFPVHRIVKTADGWQESHVAWADGFVWRNLPLANPSLAEAIAAFPPDLPLGYTTEVNLQARAWIAGVAALFERGYVVTVDYGYPASRYYAPERSEGTLLCYQSHRKSADPLAAVGAQDITAHVDFTALAQAGAAAGLRPLGFTDQHHFLVGLLQAFPDLLAGADPASQRAFQTLMHPELMGTPFKYLVQGKNTPPPRPAGLAFARPGTDLHTLD